MLMKVLVVSDSHGDIESLCRAAERERPDLALHLGDGWRDAELLARRYPDLPVEQVTWNDAMAFCEKLTEIEKAAGRLPVGYEYTLPTEAQWEYACRAGTTTALNSGKNLSDEEKCSNLGKVGWYEHNSRRAVGAIITEATHPVGQKKPNAWGLYDMHGNVWEWCLDWYGFYPTSSVTDPTGPNTGKGRVIREPGLLLA